MKIILSADDFGSTHEMNLATDYAMRNHLVCSTALIMGSAFTNEAIELARDGHYLDNVHCHLNLSACRSTGKHFVPLNETYKKSKYCKDGEFARYKFSPADYKRYADAVFQELETQYLTFQELTKGQANYQHLDFHLYGNLSLPVAIAYDRLIQKYHIPSARFFGAHQGEVKEAVMKRLMHALLIRRWRRSDACVVQSSRIEYFLARKEQFEHDPVVELFVHLDYRDNVLIDKTQSVFGNEKKPLEEQLRLLEQQGYTEFISWKSYNDMRGSHSI